MIIRAENMIQNRNSWMLQLFIYASWYLSFKSLIIDIQTYKRINQLWKDKNKK